MSLKKEIAAYILCLPVTGLFFGLISYYAYRLINNEDSQFVFILMISVWGLFGLAVGVRGVVDAVRTERKKIAFDRGEK